MNTFHDHELEGKGKKRKGGRDYLQEGKEKGSEGGFYFEGGRKGREKEIKQRRDYLEGVRKEGRKGK